MYIQKVKQLFTGNNYKYVQVWTSLIKKMCHLEKLIRQKCTCCQDKHNYPNRNSKHGKTDKKTTHTHLTLVLYI